MCVCVYYKGFSINSIIYSYHIIMVPGNWDLIFCVWFATAVSPLAKTWTVCSLACTEEPRDSSSIVGAPGGPSDQQNPAA